MSSFSIKPTLVIIGIIGIVIGASVSYFSFQPRITQLNNDLYTLEKASEEQSADAQSQIDELTIQFTQFQSQYESLSDDYIELQSDYTDISLANEDATSKINELQSGYADLENDHESLRVEYNTLLNASINSNILVKEIPGIVNGDFQDVDNGGVVGWLIQGRSWHNIDGVYLFQYDRGSFCSQSSQISLKNQGLFFCVKPFPRGGDVTFELSIAGVVIYIETFSGHGHNWSKIVVPFRPLYDMRREYGFSEKGYYEIRFTIPPNYDNGAVIYFRNVSLVEIDYPIKSSGWERPREIVNGNFEIGHDRDSEAGWAMQGRGGRGPPHAALWEASSYDSYITQTVFLSLQNHGLQFDYKPNPGGGDVTLEVKFGGIIIFSESFIGEEADFNWETTVLPFNSIYEMRDTYGFNPEDKFEIRFRVLPGDDENARVLIDNVSIIEIS